MRVRLRLACCCLAVAVLAGCAGAPRGEPAGAVLTRAEQAMGAAAVNSLRYAGSGSGAVFGQAYQPGGAWPRVHYTSFARVLDYAHGALREDYARSRAEPTGGGALPLMGSGEQRVTGLMRDGFAWNLAGPAPVAAPVALEGRFHDLWTTPHGALKAARKDPRSEAGSAGGRTWVRFDAGPALRATLWLGPDHLVERVESVQPHPVLGDLTSVTDYSGYRDFGGVRFPTRIRQQQGGFPVLDLAVGEVQINPPAGIEVPALVRAARENVTAEKAAEGVWFLAGGSHNSVAIEMQDHLIVVEAPLYDGRSQAVLAEARRLAPGKPIRFVINSHHHFDHAGGLRAAVAENATLVTSELARPWFERVLANPNSQQPDAMQRAGRPARVVGVGSRQTMGDGLRRLEIHQIEGGVHAQGFLMVYLPSERLLIEADAYTPGPPNAPPPQPVNANHLNLLQNIERLGLQVDRILPLHGRMVPLAELYHAVGRRP